MPSELINLTIQSEDGAIIPIKAETKRMTHVNHTARREQFCRLMAQGDLDELECYTQAFHRQLGVSEALDRTIERAAKQLMKDPDVVLRIQQLREPVARKHTKKLEYTLQRAFEQCDEAYNIARATMDPKTMVKAIELQGQFAKLINQTINVNHRHGLLDDASTEVLLEMKKKLETQQRRQKRLSAPQVEAEVVSETST